MAGWAFKDRKVAERLKKMATEPSDVARDLNQSRRNRRQLHDGGFIFKVPVAGISARAGTTPGSGSNCVPYYINSSGTLEELQTTDGSTVNTTLYHLGETAITSDGTKYVLAKMVYGKYVVDVEYCE